MGLGFASVVPRRSRVAVDVTGWASRRGWGRFVRNVVSRLVELDGETSYVLIHPEGAAWADELPAGAQRLGLPLAPVPGPDGRPVGDLWRLASATRSSHLRALVFPSVRGWFPFGGAPTVVGVHDLIGTQTPHLLFARRRDRVLWRAKETVAIRRAGSVFTVSAAVKRDLTSRFGLRPEAVEVVHPAPDPAFAPPQPGELERHLEARGLARGGYLVYSGGISPRKGLETLVDAYGSLRAARGTVPPLLVVGEPSPGQRTELGLALRRRTAAAGLGDVIRFTGFLPDAELACLYAGALAAVSASRSEGFGLPAVEAAACGTPSVLSDLPAHRETLDGAARFFAPGSVDGLSEALRALLDDPEERNRLAARANRAVARFSWEHAARRLRGTIDLTLAA
jgi:glycosyltransferase involved in cell wall biosynthesis